MSLSMGENNTDYRIVRIGGRDKTRKQLYNMGLIPGAKLKIVNSFNNNFIILIKESRLGIDEDLATKIFIEPAV